MVYILLADGFEEIEALCPADMLRRAGAEVKLVGMTGKTVTGAHGIKAEADLTAEDISGDTPDMLVLPGGQPGTDNLDAQPETHAMLRRVSDAGGFIGAICAAPKILGYSGYLCGKKATCFPGFDKYLIGALKTDEKCVRDGNIITACAMGAAVRFGAELIAALYGRERAEKILAEIKA